MTDKALSLVPQILAAHQEAVTIGKKSLEAAVKCGELLLKAKEAVAHGDWSDWLGKNCPDIKPRTARTYMQLADPGNKEKLDDAKRSRGADLGVGAARAALAKPKTEEEKAQAKAKANATKAIKEAAIKEAIKAASASIEDQLRDLAPDEVLKALEDADWETEKLAELADLLTARLKKVEAPAAATTSADWRRPLTTTPTPTQ
jgi:hypothetical protein